MATNQEVLDSNREVLSSNQEVLDSNQEVLDSLKELRAKVHTVENRVDKLMAQRQVGEAHAAGDPQIPDFMSKKSTWDNKKVRKAMMASFEDTPLTRKDVAKLLSELRPSGGSTGGTSGGGSQPFDANSVFNGILRFYRCWLPAVFFPGTFCDRAI